MYDFEIILKFFNYVDIMVDLINYFIGFYLVLINGRGEYDNNMVFFIVFWFDVSEIYFFCVILVVFSRFFFFLIFGIKLIVKEIDGDEILFIIVDKIIIYFGERYDIELNF